MRSGLLHGTPRNRPVKARQARNEERTIPGRADLSRASFAHSANALQREWLVTNGLGGFACASVALANTRRYHGVLVASLRPPVQRVLMVAKVEPTVRYRGAEFRLGCSEFADGTLAPRGFEWLSAFRLDDGLPTWTYALADALLEQRIWMADGCNTTYVSFTLSVASAPVDLELLPLCTYRDYHSQPRGGWGLAVEPEERGCRVTAFAGAQPYRLLTDRGEFALSTDWYWNFHHRVEAQRGLDAQEDLFRPGLFRARLEPGETLTLIATAESAAPDAPAAAPPWIRRLTLAADPFIVRRARPEGTPDGKAVEINALWHYALFSMANWARTLHDSRAALDYEQDARRVAAAFAPAFWFEAGGYLHDVVEGPEGTPGERGARVDASLRPNQIFAVSLGTELLDARRARAIVDTCARELLTPVGLRSLSPRDPRYVGQYCGGPRQRDGAYHQGTVWSWLLAPFALAHYRVYGDPAHAQALLAGLAPHLDEACIGTVSEIMDGDAPHAPRGCFAQAWSVSETLRAWHMLSRAPELAHRG